MADKVLAAQEFARCIRPRDALSRLAPHYSSSSAVSALYQRMTAGAIFAIAETVYIQKGETTQNLVRIPNKWWEDSYIFHSTDTFWISGDTLLDIKLDNSYRHRFGITGYSSAANIIGAKLNPECLKGLIDPSEVLDIRSTPVQSSNINAGGAPKKEFWDDLWVEVAKRLYNGDLIPKNQADIEKFMLDWAATRGLRLSESSVKKPAQKMFRAINSEGKN